jgi:hypothetical protein
MNGKIDKSGCLCIQRNGKMQDMRCPFTVGPDQCGDWCALFAEPETSPGLVELDLCHSMRRFTTFTDEREK